MSDDLVLGIDVGTTSVKCVVMKVDKHSKVILVLYSVFDFKVNHLILTLIA